jgi:hypothetical protein
LKETLTFATRNENGVSEKEKEGGKERRKIARKSVKQQG